MLCSCVASSLPGEAVQNRTKKVDCCLASVLLSTAFVRRVFCGCLIGAAPAACLQREAAAQPALRGGKERKWLTGDRPPAEEALCRRCHRGWAGWAQEMVGFVFVTRTNTTKQPHRLKQIDRT